MITIKMPVIKQEVYCRVCNTLDTLDFVPVSNIIDDIWNYFSTCKKCKSPIFSTYIDEELLKSLGISKKYSLEVSCQSCNEHLDISYNQDGYEGMYGSFHPRFYQILNDTISSVYYICPITNNPIVHSRDKLLNFVKFIYGIKEK